MNKINRMIKDKKEMITFILLGFTFVTSIYSTIKISELENKTRRNKSELSYKYDDDDGDDLSNRLYDIEKRLNMR
jgi:hypothetical protein